jgi:2'-5' RNA ligase
MSMATLPDNSRFARFLQSPYTVASVDRDFHEWHKGIKEYGVWVIVIDDPAWLACWQNAVDHLGSVLHPDYRRQPHITLATCGLMDERHFSRAQLDRQIALLQKANPIAFSIECGSLNSFSTAPYLEVRDESGNLAGLNQMLGERMEWSYIPHLTVGFYRDAYATQVVAEKLASFDIPGSQGLPFMVRELHFCTYQTNDIKGRLDIRHRIRLNT